MDDDAVMEEADADVDVAPGAEKAPAAIDADISSDDDGVDNIPLLQKTSAAAPTEATPAAAPKPPARRGRPPGKQNMLPQCWEVAEPEEEEEGEAVAAAAAAAAATPPAAAAAASGGLNTGSIEGMQGTAEGAAGGVVRWVEGDPQGDRCSCNDGK
jgi:hypothetical protein